MDIERERNGITIKAQTAALTYTARDNEVQPELIGHPGHVGLARLSRSLSACEALLVVDASQVVEAQTVANCYARSSSRRGGGAGAQDGPAAGRVQRQEEIEDVRCSAKTGEGVDDVIEGVIARIPPPEGDPDGPLKALVIDSWFDNYVGVVMLVRVVDGRLGAGERIRLMAWPPATASSSSGVHAEVRGATRYMPARWKHRRHPQLKARPKSATSRSRRSCPTTPGRRTAGATGRSSLQGLR